jgi:hypothetical protein
VTGNISHKRQINPSKGNLLFNGKMIEVFLEMVTLAGLEPAGFL